MGRATGSRECVINSAKPITVTADADDGFRFEAGQESSGYAAVLNRKQMTAEFRPKLAEMCFMEAAARPVAGMTARRTRKIALLAARLAKNATKPSKPRMFSTRARL